jgi:hypothetical protein
MKLSARERRVARRIGRQAYIAANGDYELAMQLAEEQTRIEFIDPATIIAIIQLIIMLIKWWYERGETQPPVLPVAGDPDWIQPKASTASAGAESPMHEPQGRHQGASPETGSLWGQPPSRPPMNAAWRNSSFAPAGRFGPREAASVGENLTLIQAVVVPTSLGLELLADHLLPNPYTGLVFGASLALQTGVFLVLKVLASVAANYGETLLRNVFAWMYEWFWDWLPLGPRARERRRQSRRGRRRDRREKRRRRWRD